MRVARVSLAAMVLSVLIVAQSGLAEPAWPQALNPLADWRRDDPASPMAGNAAAAKPSSLEKLGAGTKKFFADLGTGTKRFFTGVNDVLTGKKRASKKGSTNSHASWSLSQQQSSPTSSRKKKSSLDWLLGREEPEPVESLKDWVGLPRLDP
jgi:hypothetical protein